MKLFEIYHNLRRWYVLRKFGPKQRKYKDFWTNEEVRSAFRDAWICTGDTRHLIDYLELRLPQDNRYFEKQFRLFVITSVFRRYDEQRSLCVDFYRELRSIEDQKRRHEELIKKYFG